MVSVEVLSPAGSWDCLKAAVSEGADAVYFGLQGFNARARAENFRDNELAEVVSYCHERGVRAYLTANTLVKNKELPAYFRMVEAAYSGGVDALIIQELPLARLIKESYPELKVHASTQACVSNSYHMKLFPDVDRVILPREFTLNQIKDFRKKTGVDVEIFVQGALCYSVSGQCLMSSFLGGRSGNRGLCAQQCRKKYNGSYLLSTKDLCVVEKIPQLLEAGVSGLKIEGRLRSPEYVGAATALYRRMIDDKIVDWQAYDDMRIAFNREYTVGAAFKEYDVVSPQEAGKRGVLLGTLGPGNSIKLEAEVRIGDGVGIHNAGGVHGDIIRRIRRGGADCKAGLKGQTVELALNAKEGDTIVLTSGAMRRKHHAPRKRQKIVVERRTRRFTLPKTEAARFHKPKLLVKTYSPKGAVDALEAGADRAYYNVFNKDYPGGRVSPYVPRCLSEWNAAKAIELVKEAGATSILCGDPGVATQFPDAEVYADTSANVFNDIDVSHYNRSGIVPIVSPELSLKELSEFSDKRFAVYAHGRLPLMTTRYALKASQLRDGLGYVFPVRCELDYKQILNSVPLGLYDGILKLKKSGITEFLLDLDTNISQTISTYKRILSGEQIKKPRDYTTGNYAKGVA
ncbi:MAG: U32 family peptidase [Candidatus Altiarchaeota archaeon]